MTEPGQVIHLDFCDLGPRRVKMNEFFFKTLQERFNVQLTTSPDFLLYSHGGEVHRLYTCKKIYWTSESDAPDFRQCDYAMTSRYVEDPRHLRVPFYIFYVDPAHLVKQPDEWKTVLPQKTKFCSFFTTYANRKTRTRIDFFQKLSRRKPVDSAGRALNNIGRTIPFLPLEAKQEFMRPYKFYLAFENESVPGYVTEKLVEGMRARCIPIYYGSRRVVEDFNPKSFLNYHDFPSEEALIDRIMEIDQNDDLLAQYLKEPFFHGNQPNIFYDRQRILDFFGKIFADRTPPVGARRRLFGRWTLVRQNKPHAMM